MTDLEGFVKWIAAWCQTPQIISAPAPTEYYFKGLITERN